MMDNRAITPKKIVLGLSLPKTCPNAPEFDCIDGLGTSGSLGYGFK